MTKFTKLITTALLSSVLMFCYACDENNGDNDNTAGPSNNDYYMTANFTGDYDGTFEALPATCVYEPASGTIRGAEDDGGNSSSLSISSHLTELSTIEGKLTVSQDNLIISYGHYDNGNLKTFTATSGTVNITSNRDDLIAGTFEFKANTNQGDTVDVEGEFNVQKL